MKKNKESPGNFNKIVAVVSMEITHEFSCTWIRMQRKYESILHRKQE